MYKVLVCDEMTTGFHIRIRRTRRIEENIILEPNTSGIDGTTGILTDRAVSFAAGFPGGYDHKNRHLLCIG